MSIEKEITSRINNFKNSDKVFSIERIEPIKYGGGFNIGLA